MRDTLTLTRPDDWHLHFRDGNQLQGTVPATARVFRRAIVMPNLTPPVTSAERARSYRERILAAAPAGSDFEPLMVIYLTDATTAADIAEAAASAKPLAMILIGFLVFKSIVRSCPPASASRAFIRPPRLATIERPPTRTTAAETSSAVCSAPPVSSSGMTCSKVKCAGSDRVVILGLDP